MLQLSEALSGHKAFGTRDTFYKELTGGREVCQLWVQRYSFRKEHRCWGLVSRTPAHTQ